MSDDEVRKLPRVESITLDRFKSFKSPVRLDFGGSDIVLLTGPNGSGKTSVVEALELAVTGDIQRRIGQDRDSQGLRTFCYSAASSDERAGGARVEVSWTCAEPTAVSIGLKNQVDGNPLCERIGGIAALRAQCFLYSESLGSILGLDEKARKTWLDAFMLPRKALGNINVESLDAERVALLTRAMAQLSSVTEKERLSRAAAKRVQEVVESLGMSKLQLVKTDGSWHQRNNLKKWLESLLVGVPALPEVKETQSVEPSMLDKLAASFDTRALQADERERVQAREHSAAQENWFDVMQALEAQDLVGLASVPAIEQILSELQALPMAKAAESERQGQQDRQLRARNAIQAVWAQVEVADATGRARTVDVGTLPLLHAWQYLLSATPDAAARLGLPPTTGDGLEELKQKEIGVRSVAEEDLRKATERLAALDDAARRRAELGNLVKLVQQVLDSWRKVETEPLPLAGDKSLDLEAARAQVRARLERPAEVHFASEAAGLRAVASAFRDWAKARQAQEDATREMTDLSAWRETAALLENAKVLLDAVRTLESAVRRRHIESNYEKPINATLRRILNAYTHRERVREHVRVFFDSGNALRLSVGKHDNDSLDRGLMSLSRSQYTSAMLALALATNLGQPEPRLGFVCLDDVSDALDLENLAADAQLFRQIAYGPRRLRQLILTNHNEEITDRLVPRILPPAGCSMRVIQLRPRANDNGVDVEHWAVRGEPFGDGVRSDWSPLMDVLP